MNTYQCSKCGKEFSRRIMVRCQGKDGERVCRCLCCVLDAGSELTESEDMALLFGEDV